MNFCITSSTCSFSHQVCCLTVHCWLTKFILSLISTDSVIARLWLIKLAICISVNDLCKVFKLTLRVAVLMNRRELEYISRYQWLYIQSIVHMFTWHPSLLQLSLPLHCCQLTNSHAAHQSNKLYIVFLKNAPFDFWL